MILTSVYKFTLLVTLLKVLEASTIGESVEFNRDHTGVVFSPYVRHAGPDGKIPPWNSYTLSDVKQMLQLTSTKFSHITTYGMGVGNVNASWNEGDAVGFTAVAAAQVNRQLEKNHTLSMTVGIWQNENYKLLEKETMNAFDAAMKANDIFRETVWGAVVSSNTWIPSNWTSSIQYLREFRPISAQNGLKFGIRLGFCDQIIPKQKPENVHQLYQVASQDHTGEKLLSGIQRVAREVDFVLCTMFPDSAMVAEGVKFTVDAMGSRMKSIDEGFRAENPAISVWFETGWPSAGISKIGSKNTGRNLRTYWTGMSKYAVAHQLNLYMFTVFDEPWKIGSNKDKAHHQGPNGAESHYGWWRLMNNSDFSSFEEKIMEKEPGRGLLPGETVAIVLAVIGPIIALLLYLLHRANKRIEKLSEQDIKEFLEGVSAKGKGDQIDYALHLPYDKSLELSKSVFFIDEMEVLGSGAFGVVYKGKINGVEGFVAFKKPNKDVSASQLKNLLSEIKIMAYIGKHENVVNLLGAYTERIREGIVYIASECCTLGSLESYLRNIPRTFTAVEYENFDDPSGDAEKSQISVDTRYVNFRKNVEHTTKVPTASLLKWSYQIAHGMEHLGTKKVIHADLATRNVLLTEDGTAKITDFGLSRRLYEYTQYVKASQEPLPWRWMAIESLQNLSFSSMSDVWSYGVTLWEIFSLGDIPYPGLSWDIDFVKELERGLRMTSPKYASPEIYEKMTQCWHIDPQSRPSFTDLKGYFEILGLEEVKLRTS